MNRTNLRAVVHPFLVKLSTEFHETTNLAIPDKGDDEELLEGVRCIATPVRNYSGRVVGALSISGPSVRMNYEKLGQLKDPLVNTAGEISKKLGNPNGD